MSVKVTPYLLICFGIEFHAMPVLTVKAVDGDNVKNKFVYFRPSRVFFFLSQVGTTTVFR